MTEKQFRSRKAARDHNSKIRLEVPFRRELIRYFNYVKRIYRNGLPIPSIKSVLENHYRRVVRRLLSVSNQDAKANDDREKIRAAVIIFLTGMPERQASIIDATTQKKIIQATQQLIDSGVINPTRSDVANVMNSLNKARVTSIAMTETQFAYEGSKNSIIDESHNIMQDAIVDSDEDRSKKIASIAGDWESFQVAAGVSNGEAAGILFSILAAAQKTWFHMHDKKVRDWHRAAGGQTVHRSQPFIVGGELLMYPGDMSLGASFKNTSNCRCVSA